MAKITDILTEYSLTNVEDTDKNGCTVLHLTVINPKFIQQEMIEILKILLDGGANPKIENKKNETVLQVAVKNKMKDVIDFLLKSITNNDLTAHFFVNEEYQKFSEFSSSIKLDIDIRSVETESASFVEWLCSRGFDFDSKNERNQSALYMAIELNLQHILPILLKYTKDINLVDQRNRTLLHFFLECKANNYGINKNWYSKRYESKIVKILLDRGVSVDTEDISSQMPIQIAIENEEDVEIVRMLIHYSTNINKKKDKSDTLFQMVIRKWTNSTEEKNGYYLELAQALVAKGADLNEPDKDGKRPLIYAIEKRKLHVIKFLRDCGADFCITIKDGIPFMTLIFINNCCNTGYEIEMTIFNLLLEHVTNINQTYSKGNTLFSLLICKWASSPDAENEYYMKTACTLIDKGANVNATNEYGATPLFYAVERRNLYVVEFLDKNGAEFSMKTKNGSTLLHLLVKGTKYSKNSDDDAEMKLFKQLISRGCQVNARDKTGTTPLHVAAMHSNVHVVRMLIEHGAQVNCRNYDMKTPLHFATKNPKVEVVAEVLLKFGANINAKDSRGQTTLHKIAIEPRSEHLDAGLKKLLQHGADVNIRDLENRTALTCARFRDLYDWHQKRQTWVDEENESRRQRAAQNDGDDDPPVLVTIDECPIKRVSSDVTIRLIKQFLKLKAVKLPSDEQVKDYLVHYYIINNATLYRISYNSKCMKEVEILKSTLIGSRTSLYDFLHMDPNSKLCYMNNKKLRTLVCSPIKLREYKFHVYGDLIVAKYYEAIFRKVLIEPARKAWFDLTEINLPAVCVDLILSYLHNADLFFMLENCPIKINQKH